MEERSKVILERSVTLAVLVCACVSLFAFAVSAGPVSFDGGMNLLTAKNFAESGHYARVYGDAYPFPLETDSLFIFLASLCVRLFGHGLFASQVPNLVFATVAVMLFFVAISHVCPRAHAAAFSLLLVLTPGFQAYGFDAYGELPMTSLVLAAWLLYHRGVTRERAVPLVLSGVAIGCAISVKLIAAIAVPAFLIAPVFFARSRLPGSAWRTALALISCGVTYCAWETFRLVELGPTRWLLWWNLRSSTIADRAGVGDGLSDTASVWEKAPLHFAKLASFYQDFAVPARVGLAVFLVTALSCLAFACFALVRPRLTRNLPHPTLQFLLVFGLGYLTWWILLTPTAQAWLRRVFPGLLSVHAAMLIGAYWLIAKLATRTPAWLAEIHRVVPLFLVITYVAVEGAIASGNRLDDGREVQSVTSMVDKLTELPETSQVFGIGWYSAPQYSFYSGRTFANLSFTPANAVRFGNAYLLLDANALGVLGSPIRGSNTASTYLQTFSYEPVLDLYPRAQLLKVTGFAPMPKPKVQLAIPAHWNADNAAELVASAVLSGVRVSRFGVLASSSVRGWISARSGFCLRIKGQTFPGKEYGNPLVGKPSPSKGCLTVTIGGKVAASRAIAIPSQFEFEIAVPDTEDNSEAVFLAVESDFLRIATMPTGPHDPSQWSYVITEIRAIDCTDR